MSGAWDKLGASKPEISPEEKDKAMSDWIQGQQKVPVSPINLICYGWDGSAKSGACMDIRGEDEQDKTVFVIDVDGSASPIHLKYFDRDPKIIVVDPIGIAEETGDIDWVGSYQRILDITRYLRKKETELNLKGVVIDGLDTLLKICEMKMKLEDLRVNPQARVTDTWSWGFRNSAFLLIVKMIKGLKCDRLYTTHKKYLTGWTSTPEGGRTIAITGETPIWEKTTPNLMFQKLKMERVEKGKLIQWIATVDKCKTNSTIEGKQYVMLSVNHATNPPEVEWNGIKDLLKECR